MFCVLAAASCAELREERVATQTSQTSNATKLASIQALVRQRTIPPVRAATVKNCECYCRRLSLSACIKTHCRRGSWANGLGLMITLYVLADFAATGKMLLGGEGPVRLHATLSHDRQTPTAKRAA